MERKIRKMPDKETLEAFMKHGSPREVVYNIEKGEFEWIQKKPEATSTDQPSETSKCEK